MVERIYKEKEVIYSVSGSNPWYSLLNQIADAIVELCGAEITATGTGSVTMTLPDFPGVLYLTAPSGTSTSSYFYMRLRKQGSSADLVSSYGGYPQYSGTKGSVTVGYVSIGGFLNVLFIGPTAYPSEGYWMCVKWHWYINSMTGEKVYALYGNSEESGSYSYRIKSRVNGITNSRFYLNCWSEDLSTKYSGGFESAYQYYYSFPSDTAVRSLVPIYNFTNIPDAGLCRWGGEYMLFVLCPNSSTSGIATESQLTYRVNGKNYLACGSTLIIPEPWPFIEEA